MARILRKLPLAPARVFGDSGPWIAGQLRRDQYHTRAMAVWGKLRAEGNRLMTTTFVMDEAVTFVRYREGLAAARRLGDSIMGSALVELVEVDRPLVNRAWELFVSSGELELSFTDCTSFAVIEQFAISRVFGFDEDFRATGAELLG
ncbi:MAG: PIN domain-containing protein [Candidatus Riflebacteria bacterium]|nr:PIN domain-containing protein [Candidatus Riflebacteria bacterium]